MPVAQYPASLLLKNNEPRGFDGESSISSTLTVDDTPKNPLVHAAIHLPIEQRLQKPASVSFNVANNVEYEEGVIYDDEEELLWYSRSEYKQMKRSYIALAKQFQKYDRTVEEQQAFKPLLSKAFHACLHCKADLRGCLLEESDEKALRDWLKKGSRRGMERISVIAIFADRASRRKMHVAAILETQEAIRDFDFDERTEYIRRVSEEISRPSRLFAWRLGF
eukprot:scaffold259_cov158-Amphora_coffeaeformis.AAC.16